MDDYKRFLLSQLIQLIQRPHKNKKRIVRRNIEKVCNRVGYNFKVSYNGCEKIAEIIRNFSPQGAINEIICILPTLQIDLVIPGPPTLKKRPKKRSSKLREQSKQHMSRSLKTSQAIKIDLEERKKLLGASLDEIINWPHYPLKSFSSAYYSE
ncbi:8148_t:CDS:2 [Cetraspora pellucida]|uniref:8148_t:CDS:1 n=1 Tax=Cetraspora pellucida TaxID=1433469 RepID=A0A9N9DC92_9GLOM|nr:8148_t:CDS:2 [Cetraspora pellucida]